MDRRALLARARRRAFVPLVVATAVLLYAWSSVDVRNCPPGTRTDSCLLFGHLEAVVVTLAAVPVAAVALGLAVAVPAAWTRRLPDVAFFQRCPRSLLPVVAVTAAYAPWLFRGELVASQWAWLLLAVPFAPALVVTAVLVVALQDGPTSGPLMWLLLVSILLLLSVAQSAGYYALARGIDRVSGHLRNRVTSHRNS